jgi:hypothetical protein
MNIDASELQYFNNFTNYDYQFGDSINLYPKSNGGAIIGINSPQHIDEITGLTQIYKVSGNDGGTAYGLYDVAGIQSVRRSPTIGETAMVKVSGWYQNHAEYGKCFYCQIFGQYRNGTVLFQHSAWISEKWLFNYTSEFEAGGAVFVGPGIPYILTEYDTDPEAEINGYVLPLITDPTYITAESVRLLGMVNTNQTIIDKGFVISEEPNPTIETGIKISKGSSVGSFSHDISDLDPSKLYNFRSYIEYEEDEIYYSSAASFTTLSLTPAVSGIAKIYSPFYNGIDFSGDFARASDLVNFDLQRVKGILPKDLPIKWITFFIDVASADITSAKLYARSKTDIVEIPSDSLTDITGGTLISFQIEADEMEASDCTYFEMVVVGEVESTPFVESIFSEFYSIKSFSTMTSDVPVKVTATNNDNRHGFLTNEAFGFFETVGLNEDFFINSKTEYEYSYGRKKILSAENNVGRRITFKNLSAYNQILLKWLCNCENLYFNGVKYELISDFTEVLNDDSIEIKDLRADFVLAEQSFFKVGSGTIPKNIFTKEFFIK